jgi:hypothetical protein
MAVAEDAFDIPEQDAVLEAFERLERLLEENTRRAAAMRERIAWIRARRAEGLGYREIVSVEQPPLVVELLSRNAQQLDAVGVQVRRAEARALHDEGMTMEEIARLFGVSRQRVSTILRGSRREA